MNPTPEHVAEHTELCKLLGKLVKASDNISVFVLVTIGTDGMPCMGGNVSQPADMHEIMRQLGDPDSATGLQQPFRAVLYWNFTARDRAT